MATKMTVAKAAPRFVDDNHVLVTKEFAKNARIFGTPEYKLWREIRKDCEDAKMVTKTIKTNPNKKSTRNMTYANMEKFLHTLPDAENLLEQFKVIKIRSCTQNNPYRFVLEWFEEKVSHYDNYASFMDEVEEERQQSELQRLSPAEAA